MISIKSKRELEIMEVANSIVLSTLAKLVDAVAPGVTTEDLDDIAEESIRSAGAKPAFLDYHGYPKTLCASVNDEVVHGIPNRRRKLKDGDIIGLDLGTIVDGYYGDSAVTVGVGTISPEATRLLEATKRALELGIAEAVPGQRLGNIGAAVQDFAETEGFGVVRDYVGHGIGTALHEEPQVHNYRHSRGPVLREGMVLAIEPMLNTGTEKVMTDSDGWTVRTVDGGLSAHFENSVAITADGPKILGLSAFESKAVSA